jgi:hypothetical protein
MVSGSEASNALAVIVTGPRSPRFSAPNRGPGAGGCRRGFREDIEPNVEYDLEQFQSRTGQVVRFSREARDQFLVFATSEQARWLGNLRDLNAVITRLATLGRRAGLPWTR